MGSPLLRIAWGLLQQRAWGSRLLYKGLGVSFTKGLGSSLQRVLGSPSAKGLGASSFQGARDRVSFHVLSFSGLAPGLNFGVVRAFGVRIQG